MNTQTAFKMHNAKSDEIAMLTNLVADTRDKTRNLNRDSKEFVHTMNELGLLEDCLNRAMQGRDSLEQLDQAIRVYALKNGTA